MTFGEKVKFFREEKNLTQEELAKFMNVDRSTVGKWENDTSKPDFDKIIKLSGYFEVTTDFLLGHFDPRLFAEYVNLVRGNRTVEQFSIDTGINKSYILQMCTAGLEKIPDLEVLKKIAYNSPYYKDLLKISGYIEGIRDSKTKGSIDYTQQFLDIPNKSMNIIRESSEPYKSLTEYQELLNGKMKEIQKIVNEYTNQNINISDIMPVGKTIKIPVLGKIPAGIPVEAIENIIDYVDVPENEVKNGSYFYLQVEGDSMIGSRIHDGDRVLVKRQKDIESGEIAVVRVNSHDATLKRVKKADGQVILYPDNPAYEPIIIKEEGAEFIGKVIKVEFDPNKKC